MAEDTEVKAPIVEQTAAEEAPKAVAKNFSLLNTYCASPSRRRTCFPSP